MKNYEKKLRKHLHSSEKGRNFALAFEGDTLGAPSEEAPENIETITIGQETVQEQSLPSVRKRRALVKFYEAQMKRVRQGGPRRPKGRTEATGKHFTH